MQKLVCWKKIEHDGIAFEKIIEKLLKLMFPLDKYIHTQQTRDGGKDFVCITKNKEQYWAECKNYEDPLATSDIAKTLVMAIAEDIKKVMIFSVSPLTNVAIQEISKFIQKSPYEVKFYDGESLNSLMYEYIDIIDLSDSFKQDFLSSYHAIEKYIVFSSVTRNSYHEEYYANHFYVGDLITYNFFFKNNTQDKITFTYDIDFNDVVDELFLIKTDKTLQHEIIEVEASGYLQRSYKFRIVNYNNTLRLFDISYYTNDEKDIIRGKIIKCDWIAEVALLGESRKYFQELTDHYIGSNQLSLINIYGHSGVGKSRLLHEIRNAYENINQKIIFLPVQNTSENGKCFIKKIISLTKNLPYLTGEDIKVNSNELIYRILYDSKFDFAKNLDKVLSFIYNILNDTQRIVAIIDDLQFGDDILRESIRKILNSPNKKIIIIAGFNKDFLFNGTDAFNLFQFMKAIADSKHNKNILLSEFDNTIATEYVYNCLDKNMLQNNRLKKTIDLFLKQCGTNPLILHQTMLYLEQKEIFRKAGSYFYITNIQCFNNIIKTLTPEMTKLLKYRHSAIKKNFSDKKFLYYSSFLIMLSVFRKFSTNLYKKVFSIDMNCILEELILLGLIKYDDEGYIVFYHQKVEQFYFSLTVDQTVCNYISNKLPQFDKKYFQETFIIQNKINTITEDDLKKAINCINKLNHFNEYEFINALYDKINQYNFSSYDVLIILENYYRIIQFHQGIKFKIEEYCEIVNQIISDLDKYKNYPQIVWRIILTCVNALIQLHKNIDALNMLKLFEPEIGLLNCSDSEKKNIQASLFNRLGVINMTFSNLKIAKNYFDKSLKIGLKLKDKYKIIEAYSDYGSLYYDQKGQIIKTYKYWNKLYNYFRRTKSETFEYLFPKCYYHKIYIFLLQKKYKKAEKMLNHYKSYYWNQTKGHYKIKILFVNIVLEMLKISENKNVDSEEIEFLLNMVEDECICNGTVREYYKVFYLKALYYYYFKNNIYEAYVNYQITYKQIIGFCDNQDYMLQRYLPLLQELINKILSLRNPEVIAESDLLSDDYIIRTQKQILHVQKNNYIKYYMPLQSKDKIIKFPKL